ncbi:secreted RxLR effector protein 161-like [Nicotiana tabacum]|uniref:Secreted RxLR effector protein 161-like n=1 Tax=Nicotiana tabacum TaxID=4097 RepID=A0AC58RUZ5_TOBAC
MDVKRAFLNGFIDKEVFVKQPPGFEDSKFPYHVYKLTKALYGLKQAPRAWYDRLSTFIVDHGFTRGFSQIPRSHILTAVKRIIRYLFGTVSHGLWYPRSNSFKLEGFSDADLAGDKEDRKSTSGTCQLLGKALISWNSKKQASVALSTTEAEYIAIGQCCTQLLWMSHQLGDSELSFKPI